MKYFYLSTFIFLCNISLAQFEWQALDPINIESVAIQHVSDDDVIVGSLQYPPKILASSDLGETWEELYNDIDGLLPPGRSTQEIKQDGDDKYYFKNSAKIYRLNETTQSLELFIDVGTTILEYDFLPDGNLILATLSEVYLFDLLGNQLIKVELPSTHRKFVLGEGSQHYVIRNGFGMAIPFSSDLSDLASNNPVTIPILSNLHFEFSQGRLFSNHGYLNDTGTWTSFTNGIDGRLTILDDGRLHLIDGFRVYISSDRGESFDLLGILNELPVLYHTSTAIGEEGVLLYNRNSSNCVANPHGYSADGLNNWTELNTLQGQSLAYTIEAYDEDNIYAGTCSFTTTHFKVAKEEPWRSFDKSNDECEEINQVITTANGTVISSKRCYSENGGIDWETTLGDESYNIFHKADKTYVVDWDEVYVSEDDGKTWTFYTLDFDALPFGEWFVKDVSASGEIYVYDYGQTVAVFGPGGQLERLIQNSFVKDLKTSYSGNELFILTGNNILFYSNDGGLSSDTIFLQSTNFSYLETDHLGNVFLYGSDKLWMSDDKGQAWQDISPEALSVSSIVDIDISWDNHVYLATLGSGVLRSEMRLTKPATLTIVTYEDVNQDCIFDAGDKLMEGVQVGIGDFRLSSNSAGEIQTFLQPGTYELTLLSRPDLYASCLGTQTLILTQPEKDTIVYLPVEVVESCSDIGISSSTPFLRRCFENRTFLTIRNEGSAPVADVSLELIMDQFYEFIETDATIVSLQDSVLLLDIGEIAERGFKNIILKYTLSCDASLGMAHYLSASVISETDCIENIATNETIECRENIGSYDPNDKQVSIDGILNAEVIGEDSDIEYLIRFQNTGTDTAFTVRLEDSLSEDFNIESIRPLAASHNYEWELSRSKLIVTFNEINLVDSLTNEPDSHGFFKFGIALKDSRPTQGEIIANTAEIYFDFNEPIVTNTVESYYLCKDTETIEEGFSCEGNVFYWESTSESYLETGTYTTTILSEMGCDSTVTLDLTVLEENHPDCIESSTIDEDYSSVKVFPNPTIGILNITQVDKLVSEYQIYDLDGRVILEGSLMEKIERVVVSALSEGVYLLRLAGEEGAVYRKVVVAR